MFFTIPGNLCINRGFRFQHKSGISHISVQKWHLGFQKDSSTRKSSCVNARGIPNAAYQVLLKMGYPPSGYPPSGYPPSKYPPWPCQIGSTRGGVSPVRVPPARSDGGYPRWGTPHQGTPMAGPGRGTPLPPGPGWGTHTGVDRQNHRRTNTCRNITFPRTTYAVGKNEIVYSGNWTHNTNHQWIRR